MVFYEGGDRQHFFDGAFCDHLCFAFFVCNHDAHAAAFKVEGNFIYFCIIVFQYSKSRCSFDECVSTFDDGFIHKVFQPCLIVAVQESVTQDAVIFFAHNIQVIFQCYFVFCQCAGFVCAQNVNGTQVLDGIQVFDDHFLTAHGNGAFCQTGGYDHREHFRCQTNSNGNGKEGCIEPVPFGKAIQEQYDGHHDEHEADQYPGNGVYTFFKRSFCRFFGQMFCHVTQHGVVAGCNNNAGCAAADNVAAHESQVGCFCDSTCDFLFLRQFFHRFTFACQSRLADEQVFCCYDAQIRRNHIAGRQGNDVAYNDFIHGDFLCAVMFSGNGCSCMNHSRQFCCRIAAACFLYKTQDTGYQYHNSDDDNGCGTFFAGSCPDDFCAGGNDCQNK